MQTLTILKKLVKKSNMNMKLSAVIIRKKHVLGTGYNYHIKMGPNSRVYEHSLHAEMMALD
ncbi:hypothetical protein DRQ26_07155, partial [bacterium]